MTYLKKVQYLKVSRKWSIPSFILIIFLLQMFTCSICLFAANELKITSFTGKVKIKCNRKVFYLKQLPLILKDSDEVMAYRNASIEVLFPDGSKKDFTGPFYTSSDILKNPPSRESVSFFGEPSQWKGLERMFEDEGEESSGNTRGSQEDSFIFFKEIDMGMKKISIEDKLLSPVRKNEMEKKLESVERGFNAFPEEKQRIIRSFVYKAYGLDKTALREVFEYYKGILNIKGKQLEREFVEDYLFNYFLPLVINNNTSAKGKNFSFSSNLSLWWASFVYEGGQLKPIEKTIDYSTNPQNEFSVKSIPQFSSNPSSRNNSTENRNYLFIVGCADWTELEKLDNIKYAEEVLLREEIRETRSQSVQNFSMVVIKLAL